MCSSAYKVCPLRLFDVVISEQQKYVICICVLVHTGMWMHNGVAVLLAKIRLIEFLQYPVEYFPTLVEHAVLNTECQYRMFPKYHSYILHRFMKWWVNNFCKV